MNYFEFYGLPISLDIDEQKLKKQFYVNSKKYHPDFFTLDDVEQQMNALEMSTLNNKAFNTLKDFDKRLHYLLTLKNILAAEGENKLPQEFLMEMMDINEAVMELQFDPDPAQLAKVIEEIKTITSDLASAIEVIIPKTDAELTDEDYEALKDFYLKRKYLKRLEENIEKMGQ